MYTHMYTFAVSKPQSYHGWVAARQRTAGRWGGAGRDGTGHQRIAPPRKQPSLLPSRALKTTVLDDSSEARTKKYFFKRMEEHSNTGDDRSTSGLSAGPDALCVSGHHSADCDLRPYLRSKNRRWGGPSFFGIEDRSWGRVLCSSEPRTEDGKGSSCFGSENQRWENSSYYRAEEGRTPHLRRTPYFRSSASKNEELRPTFDPRSRRTNPQSSVFVKLRLTE